MFGAHVCRYNRRNDLQTYVQLVRPVIRVAQRGTQVALDRRIPGFEYVEYEGFRSTVVEFGSGGELGESVFVEAKLQHVRVVRIPAVVV